jgi:hypothetical protein
MTRRRRPVGAPPKHPLMVSLSNHERLCSSFDMLRTSGGRLRFAGLVGVATVAVAVAAVATAQLSAQRGRGQAGPPPAPRAMAPFDLSGYWVSVVTEDWRWRMITPAKGDYSSVPLNAAAQRLADAWDPKKDEAAGEQCRSYGAAAVMRVPGRIHIEWENDATIRVDTEAGTQSRVFRFSQRPPGAAGSAPPSASDNVAPTWQGQSVALWETGGRGGAFGAGPAPRATGLKVVTTHMRPGYLRRNGVPYSGDAVLTEYYTVMPKEENGDTWLIVTTVVHDPQYLIGRFITSTHFKKLPDGRAWHSTPCRAF